MPDTGDTYYAMEAGPVPSKIYDMLKIVRGDSYSKDVDGLGEYFKVCGWMFLTPLRKADEDGLSAVEKEVLDSTIGKYGDLTYDEIKAKSHDVAWKMTARDYPVSFENIAKEAGVSEEEIGYLEEVAENGSEDVGLSRLPINNYAFIISSQQNCRPVRKIIQTRRSSTT